LAQHGFEQVRQRGSHIVMQKRTGTSTITEPVPQHDEIRIGTLQSIIRQARWPRDVFERDRTRATQRDAKAGVVVALVELVPVAVGAARVVSARPN
jgi:predicted RNA binding protein YcfA (HicA-like mRNA interferase family)